MKTIEVPTSAEIVIKKSRFIAEIFYAESQAEVEQKIEQVRKKYYDAKHHCFASRIEEKRGIIEKVSDDGEPSGTAGMPMLHILKTQNLTNILVVVTRYFGGTLLGTGGLVRAYTQACQEAIKNANIIQKEMRFYIRNTNAI